MAKYLLSRVTILHYAGGGTYPKIFVDFLLKIIWVTEMPVLNHFVAPGQWFAIPDIERSLYLGEIENILLCIVVIQYMSRPTSKPTNYPWRIVLSITPIVYCTYSWLGNRMRTRGDLDHDAYLYLLRGNY